MKLLQTKYQRSIIGIPQGTVLGPILFNNIVANSHRIKISDTIKICS